MKKLEIFILSLLLLASVDMIVKGVQNASINAGSPFDDGTGQNLSVPGNLSVTGNTDLGGTLSVAGSADFSSNVSIGDNLNLIFGDGSDFGVAFRTATDLLSVKYTAGTTNVISSWSKNTLILKSTTTAGLLGTTPKEGEIYKISGTNYIAIATGTSVGNFGAIAISNLP